MGACIAPIPPKRCRIVGFRNGRERMPVVKLTERARAKLLDLQARQEAGGHMPCPRCGMDTMKEPVHTNALSRSADLYVCDACGTTEAMLAYMKQDDPLFLWAAFRPERPPAGFEARPAAEVLPEITGTQLAELMRIYKLCRDDPENAPWRRLEAFEHCPGLTELWPQPFQANYRAADGTVAIRFRSDANGHVQMAANILEK